MTQVSGSGYVLLTAVVAALTLGFAGLLFYSRVVLLRRSQQGFRFTWRRAALYVVLVIAVVAVVVVAGRS